MGSVSIFLEVLTLYGSIVMVGLCAEFVRLHVLWMVCCSCVAKVWWMGGVFWMCMQIIVVKVVSWIL